MSVMRSTLRLPTRNGERLIGALIPTPVGDRPPPAPAPLPVLPAPVLSAGMRSEALVVETARVDRSGRVSARHLLRALGWGPGHRVDVAVVDGVLLIGRAATGLHTVGSRGELSLPTAARRMCGITPGPPVLLAASLTEGVLVVHPMPVVARLLADWYTRLTAGRDDGCSGPYRSGTSATGPTRGDRC
jgi:hypothetical protein